MNDDHVIWTPQGIHVPAHLADRIRAEAEPAYRGPDLWPGMIGELIGTPIYVIPPRPAPTPPRRRWWIRAWHWLTRRGRRGS